VKSVLQSTGEGTLSDMKHPRQPDEYSLRSRRRFLRARRNLPSSSDSEDESQVLHNAQREQ
jgi:hypothetical protein